MSSFARVKSPANTAKSRPLKSGLLPGCGPACLPDLYDLVEPENAHPALSGGELDGPLRSAGRLREEPMKLVNDVLLFPINPAARHSAQSEDLVTL